MSAQFDWPYATQLENDLIAAEARLTEAQTEIERLQDRLRKRSVLLAPTAKKNGPVPFDKLTPAPTGAYLLACGATLDLDDMSIATSTHTVVLSALEVRLFGALVENRHRRVPIVVLKRLAGIESQHAARQHFTRIYIKLRSIGLPKKTVLDVRGGSGGYRLLLADQQERSA